MNCIIIDDEKLARTIISKMIIDQSDLQLTAEFNNAIDAIKFLNDATEEIDIIFLDIHMPDFTGFDFVKTLKNPPAVILCTSDSNFALQAFEYPFIMDYLIKPITDERFEKAILKVNTFISEATSENQIHNSAVSPTIEKHLYVNIERRLVKIEIQSITIIEAKGDYILIKTETGNHTVHSSLKKIEKKLPSHLFLKVHRTYLINTNKIIDFEDNSVLIGKNVVPVSRSNRSELLNRLNTL